MTGRLCGHAPGKCDYDGSKGMLLRIQEFAIPWKSKECCAGPNGYQEATCTCDEDDETLEALIIEYGNRRIQEASN